LEIKVARIFNTYGPRMQPDDGRVISNLIMQALQNKDITIYGDGRQTRSFCYVADQIEALVRLMDSADELTGPINLGNPCETTILELAHTIIDLTGSHSALVYQPLPSDDPQTRCPDISQARNKFGWEPTVPLKEGLVQTIEHLESLLRDQGQDRSLGQHMTC